MGSSGLRAAAQAADPDRVAPREVLPVLLTVKEEVGKERGLPTFKASYRLGPDLVLTCTAPTGLLVSRSSWPQYQQCLPTWITCPGHSLWLSIQSPTLSQPLRTEDDPNPLSSGGPLSLPTAQPLSPKMIVLYFRVLSPIP